MKTILFFSGGMDSTYVLYKLLTETDDVVRAVYLRKPVGTNFRIPLMTEDQLPLLNSLVTELKAIRDFEFVVHDIETSNEELRHWYLQAVTYAAPLLNSGEFDRMSTGRTWEQHDQKCFIGSTFVGTPSEMAVQKLWDRDVTQGVLWNPLETHEYHQDFCRAHALTHLPTEIQALTTSCHYPVVTANSATPCGNCHRCLWDEKVKEMMLAGYNTDQINVYRKLKGLQYGGGNEVSAPMRAWLPVEMGKGTIWAGQDTIQKIQARCQTQDHYTYDYTGKTGLWSTETSDQ